MESKIHQYIKQWKDRGYTEDIPDRAPGVLTRLGLVPSYELIAKAILSNDHTLKKLGFTPKKSGWYSAYKKIELTANGKLKDDQLYFF